MTLESKLRALIAGMRYAADKCDEYASNEVPAWFSCRHAELARAAAYRADAAALESVLNGNNEHNEVRDAR